MSPGRSSYGPVQLAEFLGLARWQFDRARAAGLIARPDRPRGRWSAPVAEAALRRFDGIKQAAGTIPDVGAGRAAEILSARLGVPVLPAGVVELARRELLPEAGSYKGWPLYDGLVIEAFTDAGLATEASLAGQLRTADASARYLRIRRADFNHLTRLGLLTPAEWCPGPFDSRHHCSVPLYRAADLDTAATDTRVPWPAVRATRPGHRSPLARIRHLNHHPRSTS